MILLLACSETGIRPVLPPVPAEPIPVPLGQTERTDRFLQVVQPQVDVLWIVDNSLSMVEDRELLAQAFPRFVDWFLEADADWHVGVITTDMVTPGHQGALQARFGYRYIDADTPDPEEVFDAMVTDQEPGALDEEGREAAWVATELLRDTANAGFLHESELAWLHFTVVSDEDDDSDRIGLEQFADYVDFIRPLTDRTTFNSIVSLYGAGPEEAGEQYLAMTDLLGGAKADINDPQWPAVLADLGGSQAPAPIIEFFLSARPVAGTVDVRVQEPSGVVLTFVPYVDWTWSVARNSVTFLTYIPPSGATVEVHYVLAGT